VAHDAVVSARDVLAALSEVRRTSSRRAWSALEAAEPDLAEFALEELTAIHHRLLATGATPRQVRRLTRRVQRLALVLATALRRGRLRLWREDDPPASPRPPRSPSADPGTDPGGRPSRPETPKEEPHDG
jgi:hypothetical protein